MLVTHESLLQNAPSQIHERLLEFYGEPIWRNPCPPIDELVSTILSQNTNDINRDRALTLCVQNLGHGRKCGMRRQWMSSNAIRPAGLANQKGPRIQQVLLDHRRARQSGFIFSWRFICGGSKGLADKFNGVDPRRPPSFSVSPGKPAFPVDTHIYRVTGRIGLRPEKMTVEQAHPHLESLFPPETYYAAHLNIIRLGREICTGDRTVKNAPL